MIDIVCRSLFPWLAERMKDSALSTADGDVNVFIASGNMEEMTPKIVNELGSKCENDIIVFCHDDIVFHEQGWDTKLIEEFYSGEYDILGVVGSKEYEGGDSFSAGFSKAIGKYISDIDGKKNYMVKIYSPESSGPAKVVDGCFMAVRKDHFAKEKFDEKLTFFVEQDYCLRGKVGIAPILIGHYKTPELYGAAVWPVGQNLPEDSKDYFHKKHGLTWRPESKDRKCCMVDMATFLQLGQSECYKRFLDKYSTGGK